MQRIEGITGEQKRRRYTPEDKARFIALAMQPGYTVSLVARQYGIKPSLLFKWKRPEKMLGCKTMEAEILRDALEIAQVKKLISCMPRLPPDDTPSYE